MVKEEGEVGREVVLESLTSPIRELSQQVSSVPSFNIFRDIPLGNLKRLPIPGLDVVIGVTSYQIADMAKTIASAHVRTRRIGKGLEKALTENIAKLVGDKKASESYGVEITANMARGAMHAGDDRDEQLKNLVTSISDAIIQAAAKAGIQPEDAVLGTGQGIIRGAIETGTDFDEAVHQTIETARNIASKTGLSEEDAVIISIEGMQQAARGISEEVYSQVLESIMKYR